VEDECPLAPSDGPACSTSGSGATSWMGGLQTTMGDAADADAVEGRGADAHDRQPTDY